MSVSHLIAQDLGVKEQQVRAAIDLLDCGATVPFIARYRKEATRGLDDIRTYGEPQFFVLAAQQVARLALGDVPVEGDGAGWSQAQRDLAIAFTESSGRFVCEVPAAAADRFAEAAAEWLHARVRREWGYGRDESLSAEDLIEEKYRGIRPAPGYPACPDHTEKRALFDFLRAPTVGIELTDSFAMMPASSVSGFYLAHPQAQYFAVGKIDRDQVEDYARRKGMTVVEAERWLAPNLGYEPS